MARTRHILWLCLLLLAPPHAHAQTLIPVPQSQLAPPRAEDAIAALHAAIDAILQQRKEHQQFLFTLELDEIYSTLSGRIYEKKSMKFDNLYIDGRPYARLIERDGKPLSKKEAAEEEKKYQKALESHNRYAMEDHFSKVIYNVSFNLHDVQSSYTLRYVGWEMIAGRRAWRIDAFPPPPHTPASSAEAEPMRQVKVTFWIDEQTKNLVRTNKTLYQPDDQLLAGSRTSEEYIQVDGIYCRAHTTSHLMLQSGYVIDSEHIYTNYRKFTSTSKILPDTETVESSAP